MLRRVLALGALFLLVTLVSAPWLQSQEEGGVPHFNAAPPAKGAGAYPDSHQGPALGRERPVSVPDACL